MNGAQSRTSDRRVVCRLAESFLRERCGMGSLEGCVICWVMIGGDSSVTLEDLFGQSGPFV